MLLVLADEHRGTAVKVAFRIESNVIPVDESRRVRPSKSAAAGALGWIWLRTVLRSKNTLALPVAGSMRKITPWPGPPCRRHPPGPREIA